MNADIPKGLPANAKLAFKGVIFEVWQWEQKMYDGSTAIFERLKRPDSALALVVSDAGILIQDQEQPDKPKPFISLPGGVSEEGEEPLAAAQRELLEEEGLSSDDWTLWKSFVPGGKTIWTIHIFIARNCKKTKEPQHDAGERTTSHFVSFDEFLALADEPRFRDKIIASDLIRARYDPAEREKLKTALFGTGA